MKCHICCKEIEEIDLYTFNPDIMLSDDHIFTCPEGHVELRYYRKELVGYTMFWDADDRAFERYKIDADMRSTTLYVKQSLRYYGDRSWIKLMDIDQQFPLLIKNDVLFFNREIIQRLQRLKLFA